MKILKWIGIVLLVVIVGIVSAVFALRNRKFEAPYPDIQASTDSAVIARGKYLIYGPAHCAHCHGDPKDLGKVEQGEAVPLIGGYTFEMPIGKIHVPNITPDETGIGKLSDKEIARSLRYAVGTDGRALPDFMPFYYITKEDMTAIISYLRSQQPVKHEVPKHEFNFLGDAVKAFLIEPAPKLDTVIPERIALDTSAEYGKYLAVNVANCRGCHTKRDMMTGAFTGEDFAGGLEMEVMDLQGNVLQGKHYTTVNLTPDAETGRVADWSKQQFIARFRQGRVQQGSIMPWGPFSRMTDEELTAIYNFLKTVKPVKNEVTVGIQEGDPKM